MLGLYLLLNSSWIAFCKLIPFWSNIGAKLILFRSNLSAKCVPYVGAVLIRFWSKIWCRLDPQKSGAENVDAFWFNLRPGGCYLNQVVQKRSSLLKKKEILVQFWSRNMVQKTSSAPNISHWVLLNLTAAHDVITFFSSSIRIIMLRTRTLCTL